MADHGVTVQRFFVADTANDALEAAKRLSKLTSNEVKPAEAVNQPGKLCCAANILLHTCCIQSLKQRHVFILGIRNI